MGIEYEKEDATAEAKRKARESLVAPVRSCSSHYHNAKTDGRNRHPVHLVTTTASTSLRYRMKKFLWESLDCARLHLECQRARMCLILRLSLRSPQMSSCLELCGLGERPCHLPLLSRNIPVHHISRPYPMQANQLPTTRAATRRDRTCLIFWSVHPPWMREATNPPCQTKRAPGVASVLSCELSLEQLLLPSAPYFSISPI